jgi:hypothetical protein
LHIGNEAFEAVTVGERVRVQIKKSRFQVNDPFILSVGIFLESLGKSEGAPAAAAVAPKTAVAPAALPEEDEEDEDEEEGEGEEDVYADLPPLEPATPEPAPPPVKKTTNKAPPPAESAVFEMENVD